MDPVYDSRSSRCAPVCFVQFARRRRKQPLGLLAMGNKNLGSRTVPALYAACFLCCCALFLLYRLFVLTDYAFHYVDDDQALMWWGTASIAARGLREPHFLGQAYGSMLESVVAVPLYACGVPLNIALPLATMLLAVFPFFFLAAASFRRRQYMCSMLCILLPFLMKWDYDILTSIPRSFISGFPLAFVGVFLLTDFRKGKYAWAGILLCALAFTQTETTLTVSCLALLNLALRGWRGAGRLLKERGSALPLLAGSVLAIVLVYYCNDGFYRLHPHFNLHKFNLSGQGAFSLSFRAFRKNLGKLPGLAKSFSFWSPECVPVFLLLALACIFAAAIKSRDRKLLIVDLAALLGSGMFLFLDKSLDYSDALLYSQTRMFLFFPYVLLYLVYLTGGHFEALLPRIPAGRKLLALAAFAIALFAVKTAFFHFSVRRKPMLYSSAILRVSPVSEVYAKSRLIAGEAERKNCAFVVFVSDSRLLGYVSGAVNYGKYVPYNGVVYDRRTEIYDFFLHTPVSGNVLFVDDGPGGLEFSVESFEDQNLLDYLRARWGFQRYPPGYEGYIGG